MVFDYYTLRQMAADGKRLGSWKGKPVFTCSKSDLKNKGNGAFYVVYDDENKLVARTENDFYEYGIATEKGIVNEHSKPKAYSTRRTPRFSMPIPSGEKEKKSQKDALVGDVKLGLDVEAVLKHAQEMTIEDLLKDFNYGL